MMKKFLLIVLLANLTGCALTTAHINLNYTPQEKTAKIPGAEFVKVRVSVKDNRSVKDCVSHKKNGYGQEMAPIISDNDIPGLLSQAITDELKNRGFDCSGEQANVKLDLQKYYCNFEFGFLNGEAVSELIYQATVMNQDDTIIYSVPIVAQGKELALLASGDNAKASLEYALKSGVSTLVSNEDFIKALLSTGKVTETKKLGGEP